MFGAVLLVMSLRTLRIYAASGLTLAVLSWLYMQLKRPLSEALPTESHLILKLPRLWEAYSLPQLTWDGFTRQITMSFERVRLVIATLALLLGIAHICFGAFAYRSLSLESFWFCSFGLAMIITALANFAHHKSHILIIQNTLTVIFMYILLYLAQQPQIIFGTILFTALLIIWSSMLRPDSVTSIPTAL